MYLTKEARIARLRSGAVSPTICYDQFRLRFWETYLSRKELPLEERYTLAYAAAMAAEQPVIDEGELIVGKASTPFSPQEQQRWEALKPAISELCPHVGQDSHMSIDYEALLHRGISGVLEELDRKMQADLTPQQQAFYQSCVGALHAVLEFSDRYARLAENLAEETANPERKAELARIAQICRTVPRFPASNFYEAIQSAHFVTFCLSYDPMRWSSTQQFQLGRPDQYLYPYYQQDRANGTLDDEFAQTLLDCLGIQINCRVPNGLSCGYMLGGRNSAGEAVYNELTALCMEVIPEIRLVYPSVGLCVTPELPRHCLRRACEILSTGASHPAIFNDDVISAGLRLYGVPEAESHQYIHSTCVEITPIASSNVWVASPYHNLTGILLTVLEQSHTSMEDLVQAYFSELEMQIAARYEEQRHYRGIRQRCSRNPLLSCFVNDCLERGMDLEQGGARYSWIMPSFVGMANLIDSLTVIDRLIYREKKYTMAELRRMLHANYEGYEMQRLEFLNRVSKYGNDQEESDRWSLILTEQITKICNKLTAQFPECKLIPSVFCWVMHAELGAETGATPDGRKAGFPFGDGSGAAQGREAHGPTASLLSSTKWDHRPFIGGVAVNLKLSKKLFRPESVEKLLAMVQTYLERGGFELQINVVDRETLLKARENPQDYRDLIVRIGGYSDYYVKLSPRMQEEILLRTEHEI